VPIRDREPQHPARPGKTLSRRFSRDQAQLIRDIETLREDDLQSRAIAILKAKNRLSVDDAKLVEDAFAARMLQADTAPAAVKRDVPTSAQAGLTTPVPASTVAVKRPRGRSRKVVDDAEPPAAPKATSRPTVDDNPPGSAHLQADATSAKIQKSELAISEPRRHRDKNHLKFVASQPCLVCGRSPADAHHLRFTHLRAMGRKVSDEFAVPLCRRITAITTVPETKSHGGRDGLSIRSRRRGCYGFQHGASHEKDARFEATA
jgi:hypothetical protein